MSKPTLQELANEAVKALRGGQHELARQRFHHLLAGQGPDFIHARGNVQLWMGLAYACGNCKDDKGALEAVDQALALEPKSTQALLFKADHLWHCKQQESAAIFYKAVLQVCQSMTSVPPELAAQLPRAEQRQKQIADHQLSYLQQALEGMNITGDQISARFGQGLSISLGEKEFYPQQPSKFFFPELPHRQFFEPEQFEWADKLQSETSSIKAELLRAIAQKVEFEPYLEDSQDIPRTSSTDMWGSDDWGALYLWKDGQINEKLADQFIKTFEILGQLPLADIPGGSPNVLFSKLKPNTDIPPHHGFFNTRLICHLPLIVPENCGQLRVGNESRPWSEGELLIFDDSIEHEAWNHSSADRIVLIFEIWRPELSTSERDGIRQLLQIFRSYSQSTDVES